MKLKIKVSWKRAGKLKKTDVTTSLATIVAWERHFRRKASELGSGIGVEDIMFLAWHKLNADGQDERSFDDWINDVEDVEIVDAADPGPPTKPDTSGDN